MTVFTRLVQQAARVSRGAVHAPHLLCRHSSPARHSCWGCRRQQLCIRQNNALRTDELQQSNLYLRGADAVRVSRGAAHTPHLLCGILHLPTRRIGVVQAGLGDRDLLMTAAAKQLWCSRAAVFTRRAWQALCESSARATPAVRQSAPPQQACWGCLCRRPCSPAQWVAGPSR